MSIQMYTMDAKKPVKEEEKNEILQVHIPKMYAF